MTQSAPTPACRPPRPSSELGFAEQRYFVLSWFGLVLGIGTMLFLYKYLAEITDGNQIPARFPLITEMTGAFGAGLFFLILVRFINRFPLEGKGSLRRLPLYVVLLVVYGIGHTSFMWGTRLILFPLAGLGEYDYGKMPLRYFMEFPIQLVGFVIMVVAVHAGRHFRAMRERELRTAQLESSLARAQLQNLRLQLQPHFLFNALNTISSAMYDDPEAADEMLDRLSELLRISLKTAQTDEVTLETELETLDSYLAIMEARFGDRLDVTINVDEETRGDLVPSMILQPLVENAIRHGNAEQNGRGRITIKAAHEDARLRIEVEDDGPGNATPVVEDPGIGLSSTAERLRLLYGNDHQFSAGSGERGFLVSIRIPRREAKP